jgi:hypothetical protein
MTAFVSDGRVPDLIDARKPAFAASGQEAAHRIDHARDRLRAAGPLALVVHRIGQMFERRRHAEVARRSSPLSLDDAWAGGWYARSRMLQEALLQQAGSTSAKPAPRQPDWDDKLD